MRLLLDFVPELLVESRALYGAGGAVASLSLDFRFARRGDRRAARFPRRPVPALSLPHHHELLAGLPQGAQPREGDRRDQEEDGRAAALAVIRPFQGGGFSLQKIACRLRRATDRN